MDKYEYKVRSEEILELVEEKNYKAAAEIADTIDWRRVKSVKMLCTISDVYKMVRRYEDSMALLKLADEKRPDSRMIVYALTELHIKLGDIVNAWEYYKNFCKIAPDDSRRYVLLYKVYVAQDVSLDEQIKVLEKLKEEEYTDRWSYELAYLYHRIGFATKCVEECDEMILWFGEGKYVRKAMELKMLHEPLTPKQQALYNGEVAYEMENGETKVIPNLSAAMTKEVTEMDPTLAPTIEFGPSEIDEIQVKTMDDSPYNTINLQKALAESMAELMGDESQPIWQNADVTIEDLRAYDAEVEDGYRTEEMMVLVEDEEAVEDAEEEDSLEDEITRKIFAPMLEETQEVPQIPDSEEIFFEDPNTVDMSEVAQQTEAEKQPEKTVEAKPTFEMPSEESSIKKVIVPNNEGILKAPEEKTLQPTDFAKKSGFDDVLSQEADGQLSLFLPERNQVEKQITGQLNIQDILTEWENWKKEKEEQLKRDVKQRVLDQTGDIFAEFDQAARGGLLERLQNDEIIEVDEIDIIDDEVIEAMADMEAVAAEEFSDDEMISEDELIDEEVTYPEEFIEEETDDAEEFSEEEIFDVEEVIEEEILETEEVVEEEIPETEEAVEEEIPETEEVVEEEILEEEASEEEIVEAEKVIEEAADDIEQPVVKEAEPKTIKSDKTPVYDRELTEEEKELFGSFTFTQKSKEQLLSMLDNMSLAAHTGNVLVAGEAESGTMKFAKNIVREFQLSDGNFSGKAAKLTAEALNKKNPQEVVDKLKNGAIIVEAAGKLSQETVEGLAKALRNENRGVVVILVDTKIAINALLHKYGVLKESFNARFDVEAMSDDALVAYGKKYAYDLEYGMDAMGVLALHTRIADMQTLDHAVNKGDVRAIINEAIEHADKKTPKHFFDILFGKRYDSEDMIVLREEDFFYNY
ncbi:MAG: hypothetical protein E7299_01110 [Lachnospiraceae bacterium]|nr:hypothetical protein [Lachnospiraceae bacterium]